MATNPPVTIGEITTVPAPGSGVTSAYHQTVTNRVLHRFATAAAMTAAWPPATAGKGAHAYTLDTNTMWVCDGAGWVRLSEPLQTFTPTFVGVTLGNGTGTGSYHRSDGWLDLAIQLTFGSTTVLQAGGSYVGLPVPSAGIRQGQLACTFVDAGSANYPGTTEANGTGALWLYAIGTAAAYAAIANTGPAIPFAMATGDSINVSGRYQMSSRYS